MFSDSITANIHASRRTSLAHYATDMMFCYILSFEVVSAPVSSSLNYCPFLWIELLNKIKTSIFFQIL